MARVEKIEGVIVIDLSTAIATLGGRSAESLARQRKAFLAGIDQRVHRPVHLGAWVATSTIAALVVAVGIPLALEQELPPVADSLVDIDVDTLVEAPADAWFPLSFEDGSRVDLAPSTKSRLTRKDPSHVIIMLDHGRIDADIEPHTGTAWSFDAGDYRVEVVGTRFSVSRTFEEFEVTVTQGRVRVTGPRPNDSRELGPGETFKSSTVHAESRLQRTVSHASDRQTAMTTRNPSVEIKKTRHDDWRELYKRHDYSGALAQAERMNFAKLVETADVNDLAALADAARLAKQVSRATQALTQLRKRFSGSERACHAALLLGHIHFDAEQDYREAARWFETYLDETKSDIHAGEACGRLMESQRRLGELKRARQTAERCLTIDPNGPNAERARVLLE